MARDRLWLSYVGQSIVDNATRPPSVALAELLDVIAESFSLPEHLPGPHDAHVVPPTETERGEGIRRRLVLRHPMQPFSPRYFGADPDPRLYSYAHAYLQGAMAVATGRRGGATVPLLTGPLPEPEGPREVGLPQLIRFFQRPAEELLRRRLGLYLRDDLREHADREPIELDALESWRAGNAILGHRLEGIDAERSRELLRAAGQLPLGTPGAVRWDELRSAADPIAAIVTTLRRGDAREPDPVDFTIDGTRVVGRLPPRYDDGMILHQYSRVWPKTKLATWIRHLVLGCLGPGDGGLVTCIVGRAIGRNDTAICQFSPVADARAQLSELLRLYWIGQREPLLLFPKSAWAFHEAVAKGDADPEAIAVATRTWAARKFAERDDPYLQRLFGESDPLVADFTLFDRPMAGGDFPTVARAVLDPLRHHLTEA